jgi:hypothetical protein
MGEYRFRIPENCPELSAEGLSEWLGKRSHRKIGRTVTIRPGAMRETFYFVLYEAVIAEIGPEQVYFPVTGDAHQATTAWLSRIVHDNGLGLTAWRVDGRAPGHRDPAPGLLAIDGDRARPVEGHGYPVDRELQLRSREFARAWRAAAAARQAAGPVVMQGIT